MEGLRLLSVNPDHPEYTCPAEEACVADKAPWTVGKP